MERKWKCVFKRGLSPNFFTITKSYFDRFNNGLFYFNGEIVSVYVNSNEVEKKAGDVLEEYVRDFSKFEEERDKTSKLYDDVVNWAKEIRKRGFNSLSKDEVILILEELKSWYQKIGRSIWYFNFLAEKELYNYLIEEKGLSPLEALGVLFDITQPEEPSHSWKGEKRIYEIVRDTINDDIINELLNEVGEKLKGFVGTYWKMENKVYTIITKMLRENKDISEKIRNYIFNYGDTFGEYGIPEFLENDLIDNPEKNKYCRNIYKKIASIVLKESVPLKIKLMESGRERIKNVQRHYFGKIFKLRNEDRCYKFAKMLSATGSIRLKRRETITQTDYYLAPLLKKVVMDYDKNLEEFVRFLEIEDFINIAKGEQKNYKTKAKKVKNGWLWIKKNGVDETRIGKDAKNFFQENILSLPGKLMGIVRRRSKDVNIYEGIAKIVLFPRDLKKVKENDIIILLMIHPDHLINPMYWKYIKNARAIVAEEGTLSCHLLTLFGELTHKFREDLLLVTDAENATDLIKNGDRIRIDLRKISIGGKVALEVEE